MEDIQIIKNLLQEVTVDADELSNILKNIIDSYAQGLDELMQAIQDDVVNVENPPTETIEKYFIEISNATYFIASKVEKLGIFDGISKLKFKEKYNNTYLASLIGEDNKKRTSAELSSIAENSSKYENVVSDIYNRAYKILKSKVDAAQTMTSTLSKVLSYRMQQENTASTGEYNNTKKILNEEF